MRYSTLAISKKSIALMLLGITSLALVGCGSSDTSTNEADSPSDSTTQTSPNSASLAPSEPSWEVISEDINLEFATPDLGVGTQRIGVVLSDKSGLIKFPVVRLTSQYFPSGYDAEPDEALSVEASARFYLFPFGTRGIHSTNMLFDRAGLWSVSAEIPRADGSTAPVEVRFPVAEKAISVTVGQKAPASENRTLASEGNIAKLTTGSHRDPELYQYSIAEALERDRPLLIVFASPAFCTNAVCGPQVEIASELREDYGDKVDFVHVDLYSNPHEIQGDLSLAQLTPVLEEWGLSSQEWTFIIDPEGVITHRFENFAPKPELIVALDQAIAS
jgi:hypothetical protein